MVSPTDPYEDPTQGARTGLGGSDLDPTRPGTAGDEPEDDPTQGTRVGEDPFEDPLQGVTIGHEPDEDPTRAR